MRYGVVAFVLGSGMFGLCIVHSVDTVCFDSNALFDHPFIAFYLWHSFIHKLTPSLH